MSFKIGFIGAGNIASAIIGGMLEGKQYDPDEIYIYDIDQGKKSEFSRKGFHVTEGEEEVVRCADIVFLAVKPIHLKSVLASIKNSVSPKNTLISVVAGVSIKYIKSQIGKDCKVARVMPNTPSLIGEGATALSFDAIIGDKEKACILNIFETVGIARTIDEEHMNAIVSVNGSSPAYVYMFIKAIIDGASKQGIDKETAKDLALQTLIGSMKMVMASTKTIEQLITEVAVQKGTTVKAVEHLKACGIEKIIGEAMEACTKRAAELEKEIAGE